MYENYRYSPDFDKKQSKKRKYRRHPKPDPNEPAKPHSAYMIFSNEVRAELNQKNIQFSDLAKIVGIRWNNLDPMEKQRRQDEAAALKAEYHQQLTNYRSTPEFRDYQLYLARFEADAAASGRPFVRTRRPNVDSFC